MTPRTDAELVGLATTMRKAQRDYYANKSPLLKQGLLIQAKALEIEFDRAMKEREGRPL